MENKIYSINGPVVTIKGKTDLEMMEMVYVGKARLVGEVIRMNEKETTIQVYEETGGLKAGEPVESTGGPLSVTLGPGILRNIYDGIQRPLPAIEKDMGSFIERGAHEPSLDEQAKWDVTVTVKAGDTLTPGQIYATCPETPAIHRKDKKQHNVKDQHDLERHRIGAAGQQGMKDLDHQYTAQPPQQGELRADIAAQIEFHVGVIPPADVVDLEQRPAADQLNGGGQRHADEKDGHGAQAAAVRQRDQVDTVDQPHHAEAVDRADRPAEKAAVDERMGLDGGVDDLNAPADEPVQEEPVHRLDGELSQIHLLPPAAWPAPWARPRSRCCQGPCGQSAL